MILESQAVHAKPLLLRPRLLSVIVAVGLLGAIGSFNAARSLILTNVNPAASINSHTANANAMANLAARNFTLNGSVTEISDQKLALVTRQARRSLSQQLLNPVALTLLATIAETEGNQKIAKTLFGFGALQTKRNLAINLWQIRRSAEENDVAKMLVFYDRSLRTQRESFALLLPALAKVIPLKNASAPLAKILKSRPDWSPALGDAIIDEPAAWPAYDALLSELGPNGKNYFDEEVTRRVIQNLTDSGQFASASKLYTRTGGKLATFAGRAITNFETPEAGFPPFDWQYVVDGDIFVTGTRDGLELEYGRAGGTLLARRLLRFDPGSYKISIEFRFPGERPRGLPTIQVFCAIKTNAESMMTTSEPRPVDDAVTISYNTINGCNYHWLRFVSPAALDSDLSSRVIVRSIAITRLNGRLPR